MSDDEKCPCCKSEARHWNDSPHVYLKQQAARLRATEERLAEVTRERDLAVAHDRQPYPTAEAYEAACKALNASKERVTMLEGLIYDALEWITDDDVYERAESVVRNMNRAAIGGG